MQVESKSNEADIFSGCSNGTLDVSISHSLDPSGRSWDESKGDRHLHICINDDDLHSIASEMFNFVVGNPPETDRYVFKNWKDKEPQIVLAFPMLNRIDQMYADALFYADEVSLLRDECAKLESFTNNTAANLGLRKLIYSCDEALKAGLCLGLWCD
ncbi:MAG: hypothetical protein PSX80_17380 [bacterium]|nr:hypothetical protein [bacterium]